MAFKVMKNVLPDNLDAVLAEADFSGAEVHLFVASVVIDDDMSTGDFSEASWTGYNAQSVGTWSAAALDGSIAFSDTDLLTFTVTSGGTGTDVFGYYVTDTGGTNVLFAEQFDTEVPVTDGIPFQLIVRFRMRNP